MLLNGVKRLGLLLDSFSLLKCWGTCSYWNLWAGAFFFCTGGPDTSCLSAWCYGVYSVIVAAASLTGCWAVSGSAGCHFLLFGGPVRMLL